MASFFNHYIFSIQQTEEWKTLQPYFTDSMDLMNEEVFIHMYQSIQGSPFNKQFQTLMHPILNQFFTKHFDTVTLSNHDTSVGEIEKTSRQQCLHFTILQFIPHLSPRFYLPVFGKYFNELDPLRSSIWESIFKKKVIAFKTLHPFSLTTSMDPLSIETVQTQLYTLCYTIFTQFSETYSAQCTTTSLSSVWSSFFQLTCFVRVQVPYSIPTKTLAALCFVLTLVFSPTLQMYMELSEWIYAFLWDYQEFVLDSTRRKYILMHTLLHSSTAQWTAWDTILNQWFVGYVPWTVLLSIFDWFILSYDPTEAWIQLLQALIQCVQSDEPSTLFPLPPSRSPLQRDVVITHLFPTIPFSSFTSSPLKSTLPVLPSWFISFLSTISSPSSSPSSYTTSTSVLSNNMFQLTELYEHLADQVALTPLHLQNLMKRRSLLNSAPYIYIY